LKLLDHICWFVNFGIVNGYTSHFSNYSTPAIPYQYLQVLFRDKIVEKSALYGFFFIEKVDPEAISTAKVPRNYRKWKKCAIYMINFSML